MAYVAHKAHYGAQEQRQSRREFTVVEGRNSRSRQVETQISPAIINLIRIVAVLFVCTLIIGGIRIALNAQTVSVMMKNTTYQRLISEAQAEGDDLMVQQSVFGNPSRIERIAKDSLGMVPAAEVTDLKLSHSGTQGTQGQLTAQR